MGDEFGRSLAASMAELATVAADAWTAERLVAALKALAERDGRKLGDVMQPIRVALSGSTVSEPVNELLAVVGREGALRKLERFAGLHGNPSAPK